MISNKTTLLSHIYNEEYLLPFWLIHHKDMFDDIIIVDYRSNDNSVAICKKICPNCKIITTRNEDFCANAVDNEIMDIEKNIEGIKIVLNTTEFLFIEKPIKEIFLNTNEQISFSVKCYSPYSNKTYKINNNHELYKNLLNDDIFYHNDRQYRYIHTFLNGNYHTGRHYTNNHTTEATDMYIIWFGFYPFNEMLLKRKLQIKNKIPESNIIKAWGIQHLSDENELLNILKEKVNSGIPLKDISISLFDLLYKEVQKNNNIYYSELLLDGEWGEDKIMLNNDVNLLQNTDFNHIGFKIFDIENFNDLLNLFIRNEIKFLTNKEINLYHYHDLITDEEHKKILNSMPYKKNMYNDVNEFCNYIERFISNILNEPVKIFNDDIWFRICRPNKHNNDDNNPCHKDVYLDFYRNIVNIYIPVVGSNEKSSLKLQPYSHFWNENETMVTNGGAYFKSENKKYSVDAIVSSKQPLEMIRPNPDKNQMLIFSPYLIHGCATNENEYITRISLEMRFIRNDENGKKQELEFNNFLDIRNWR